MRSESGNRNRISAIRIGYAFRRDTVSSAQDLNRMAEQDEKKEWFAIEIVARPEAAEAVEYALNSLDALGTEINNLGPDRPDTLNVVGYFNRLPEMAAVADELENALTIYGLPPNAAKFHSAREVADQDWLAEWKKHWRPTECGRFVIAPMWEDLDAPDKTVIRIEPSMAFGTGTHETTRLCLKAIDEFYRPGESFFDVGTGTGILSIAVSKLNRSKVPIVACDTDSDSISIARENAEVNGAPEIEFYVGSISETSPAFDVVCANVTLDVIVPLLPLLIGKTRRMLLLSGILAGQETAIIEALAGFGIEHPAIERMGEWIGVRTYS